MFSIFLLLFSAVELIQKKCVFKSAPKDIYEAITQHPKRFHDVHLLGWSLAIFSIVLILVSITYGMYNAIINNYAYWQTFTRFLIMFSGMLITKV